MRRVAWMRSYEVRNVFTQKVKSYRSMPGLLMSSRECVNYLNVCVMNDECECVCDVDVLGHHDM